VVRKLDPVVVWEWHKKRDAAVIARVIALPKIRCHGCDVEFRAWERHSFAACLKTREWREQQALLDEMELVACGSEALQSRDKLHD
jgi:hypothetical protein